MSPRHRAPAPAVAPRRVRRGRRDVSADMIALCREQAEREGLVPTLFVQAMHELEPPRSYRTIVVCGAFGLWSTREQDREALARFHRALEPGGTLVLDTRCRTRTPVAGRTGWGPSARDSPRTGPRTEAGAGRRRRRARAADAAPLAQPTRAGGRDRDQRGALARGRARRGGAAPDRHPPLLPGRAPAPPQGRRLRRRRRGPHRRAGDERARDPRLRRPEALKSDAVSVTDPRGGGSARATRADPARARGRGSGWLARFGAARTRPARRRQALRRRE